MANITIAEVTDGIVAGTGAFDVMQKAVLAHVVAEYQSGRITGKEYATVYLGALQSSLASAVQFVLGKQAADKEAEKSAAEILLLNQKAATEEAQTLETTTYGSTPGSVAGVILKQKNLILNQTEGFIRDAEQKAAKILMDSYAIRRSTDSAEVPPTKADNADINQFIDELAAGLGITTLSPSIFYVSGVMYGLAGSGAELQISINGGAATGFLPITSDGVFTFTVPFVDSDTYTVTVKTQPTSPAQTIGLQNASGTINNANVTNVIATAT